MKSVTEKQAIDTLDLLLTEVTESHEPIQIVGMTKNGVLLSEEDYRAIVETVYLQSNPGIKDSIVRGIATPLSECGSSVDW